MVANWSKLGGVGKVQWIRGVHSITKAWQVSKAHTISNAQQAKSKHDKHIKSTHTIKCTNYPSCQLGGNRGINLNKFVQQCIALKVTSGLATKMTEKILRHQDHYFCTAQSHDPHVMDVQCDHDIDHYVDLDAGEVVGHDHDGSGGAGQHLCTAYLGRRKHWMAAWTPVPPMDLVRPPATPTWTPACSTYGATTAKVPPCPAMAWGPQSPPWGRWTSVPGPRTTRRSMGVPSISASRVSIHSFISWHEYGCGVSIFAELNNKIK